MNSRHRGGLLMLAFAALWAATELIATLLARPYSAYQIVWTRYAVHLCVMALLFGWHDSLSLIRTRRPVFQLARSLLMLLMPASWIIASQRGLDSGTVLSLFWLSPLLIVALAYLVLPERPGIRTWMAAALASAGAILLVYPGQMPSPSKMALPLMMAGSFSLYVVMTRSLRTEPTRANLFYTALGVFLCLSPLMPQVWVTPTWHDFAVQAAIGLIGCACLYMLDRASAAGPISARAPLIAVQPLMMLGSGAAVFADQRGKPAAWAATLLVAAGVIVALVSTSGERPYST